MAINQPSDAQASGQAPVLRQTFGYDKKTTGGKAQPKLKSDVKFAGKREEANLATTTVVEHLSYMVSSNDMIEMMFGWQQFLRDMPMWTLVALHP